MHHRIRLKKRRKTRKINLLVFILCMVVISVFAFLRFLGKQVTPMLLETSELEVQKISNYVANQAIYKVINEDVSFQNLFETITSSDGSIQTVDFNSNTVNQILSVITKSVLQKLKDLESGQLDSDILSNGYFSEEQLGHLKKGILKEVPVGLITKNPLLSNLGPRIPIRIHYIGDVLGNITTNITSYGINNALVQIGIHLEITAQILLPYLTKEKVIQFDIPLSIKMIQGKIPTYYSGGITKDSALYTLPIH